MSLHVWQLGHNNASSMPEKRKRTKYVAKACNHCKRRKIKCGGQQPCEGCRRQQLECEYTADIVNSDSQNIERLQEQVLSLQSRVQNLSARRLSSSSGSRRELSVGVLSAADRDRVRSAHSVPFHGPTTSVSDFDIARQSLRERGVTDLDGPGDATQEPTPVASPLTSLHLDEASPFFSPPVELFWAISREEALRLCRVYENEMGIMYPVLELNSTISQVNALYNHLGRLSSSRVSPSGVPAMKDDEVNIIKIVFACALIAEGNGSSELGMRIFSSVRDTLTDVIWRPADVQTAIILTLVSIFLFQIDEETLAWRTVGTVQRMCMELGLHRAETYSQPFITTIGHEKAVRLFWSVYTLDVRWSMGTGMPNHLNFIDIDPSLPRPTGEPYLCSMINYCRIAQKVWKFISSPNADQNVQVEEVSRLDWQAMQWYRSVPEELKLPYPDSIASSLINTPNRRIWRLKSLLYLRGNMMRIMVHRPIMLRGEHIAQYPAEASTVVDIAKASIRLLHHLNQASDIYKLQQVAFNWFLVSALAVLFLAAAHAPEQFSSCCKDEFYMALNLIEGFSMKSYVSQRLWRSIRNLRRLAPQMGLGNQGRAPQEQARNVDVADRSELLVGVPAVGTESWLPEDGDLQLDGLHMGRGLMDLSQAIGEPVNTDKDPTSSQSGQWLLPGNFWFGTGPEFSSVLKDFL